MTTIEKKSRIVFRNPQPRIWYLQRRPDQPPSETSFLLGPNQTVEALDEAEEMLLATMGLVDVAKETPAISNSIDTLKKQLEEERAKNAALLEQNKSLKAKAESAPTSNKKK